MPTEEDESETKTPSISSRTRSQTRQDPIVTVQDVDDIFQSSSSSKADSEVSDFEGSDIEQTEQYNPRALQFPTTTTTMPANMVSSLPFDADMVYILGILDCDITSTPPHQIADAIIAQGAEKWLDFKYQDPGDIPSWTYPVRNNNHSNLTNVSIAKLQFLFDFIELIIIMMPNRTRKTSS